MSKDNGFSDEHLNAFVDGQLDGAEASRVFEALNRDPELSLKVGELRKLKELAQYAYRNSTPAKVRRTARLTQSRLVSTALAASLLVIGAAGGWFWHNVLLTGNNSGFGINAAKKPGTVIQISENDPKKWDIALINANNIRKEYAAENMDIEIVVFGPGLEMFKRASSLHQRVEEAAKSGVKLIACGNTMKATDTSREELNPSVEVVKAGVVEIVQKQQQGYSYVKP